MKDEGGMVKHFILHPSSFCLPTRHYPFGGERWSSGGDLSDFDFTGQRLDGGFGLHDYNARYYDSLIGRFISADTVVPDFKNPQDLNRYSYVRNSPLNFVDPTGHLTEDEMGDYFGYSSEEDDWMTDVFNQMTGAGWNEDLARWLLNPDTHFGDVFTYNDSNEVAMLMLFEVGGKWGEQFMGGFLGLDEANEGHLINPSRIFSMSDDSFKATGLESHYEKSGFSNLPSAYGELYVPGAWKQYDKWDAAFATATALGVVFAATSLIVSGGMSTPLLAVAGYGGAATSFVGGIGLAIRGPTPQTYPVLRYGDMMNPYSSEPHRPNSGTYHITPPPSFY